MSSQRLLWLGLWIAPHVLLIAVAIMMLRKGRQKDFPIFFSYLLFEFLQFGIWFTMWYLKVPHLTLTVTDRYLRAGSIAFRFGIIQEMLESPLGNNIPLRRTVARMLNWVAAFLVILAAVFVGLVYYRLPSYELLKSYSLLESLNTAQCGLIVCVFLWHRFLGVRMSSFVLGIALGVGLVVGLEPLMIAFVAGRNLINRDSLQMVSFNLAVLGWLYFAAVRERAASQFNAAQLLQFGEWVDDVGRITRP